MQLNHFCSLAALATVGLAQMMTLQQLLDGENTTLSTLNSLLANQPGLVQTLSTAQNITILAPSNAAFIKFTDNPGGKAAAADPNAVAQLLSYHVLNGTFRGSSFNNMLQFIPTLLTDPKSTLVTGGQVVSGVTNNGKVQIFSGLKELSTVQTADLTFAGGVVHIIDTVLTTPLTPSFSAVDSNLTALAGALSTTSLITTVDMLRDVTIFAPSNEAFRAIGSATSQLTVQQLSSILTYHIINGTVGYSTLLTSGLANESFPTLNGGQVNVLVEDGKVFINSAQVTITDIVVSNGVMHVIDNVLNPSNTTATPIPTATSQAVAYSGATAASDVPFTSGIIPTTTAPSASTRTGAAGRVNVEGAVGVAALFGAGVVGMAVI